MANAVWYSCDVLNPPLDFVPHRLRGAFAERAGEPRDLVVNPTLRQLGNTGPTPEMRGRVKLRNRFQPDRSWLWLHDSDFCAQPLLVCAG